MPEHACKILYCASHKVCYELLVFIAITCDYCCVKKACLCAFMAANYALSLNVFAF